MAIRQLRPETINRIAAGEVIERPASVVKELVENAIDAGAHNIEVVTAGGGLSLIRVSDDGHGMSPDDLSLSVERHATSKLRDEDLLDIRTMGFRGEALPSIGSIALLSITSGLSGTGEAHEIIVRRGEKQALKPAAHNTGTRIEVRDLFSATPARLKFLKSERAENMAIGDVVKRLAMAHPHIGFSLTTGERRSLSLESGSLDDNDLLHRLGRIMGRDFVEDALPLAGERNGIQLRGFCGLPTLNRADSTMQFLFVNGRPVRDKLLVGAVRGAYGDLVPKGRQPYVALFIDLDPHEVDVNVHPAKSEVRFREPGVVRQLIVSGIRHVLEEAGHRASAAGGAAAFEAMVTGASEGMAAGAARPEPATAMRPQRPQRATNYTAGFGEAMQAPFDAMDAPSAETVNDDIQAATIEELSHHPLGAARAQVHENYIIAQTDNSVVIVDQHAAHERLVYQKLKATLAAGGIATQGLLIPEIVSLDSDDVELLDAAKAQLSELGLVIDRFGIDAVAVREIP
ncbi:MAG: DNA mismatch repair endonuclease MutL, partial [Pseudomonadota bacterium]